MGDLKIGYSGGSGGFLLLHFLLLTNQYYAEFDEQVRIDSLVDLQWSDKEMKDWKSTETFPNNYKTLLANRSPKLYFFCNPFDFISWPFEELAEKYVSWDSVSTKSIVIYTDITSQLILAYNKKARWFLPKENHRQYVWAHHYNNIKADTWPNCATWQDISTLPVIIQQELFNENNSYHTHASIANDIMLEEENKSKITWPNPALFDGVLVDDDIFPYLKECDYSIRLQDFVNTRGKSLVTLLNLPDVTNSQKNLIDKWIKLHDPTILRQIGINT